MRPGVGFQPGLSHRLSHEKAPVKVGAEKAFAVFGKITVELLNLVVAFKRH